MQQHQRRSNFSHVCWAPPYRLSCLLFQHSKTLSICMHNKHLAGLTQFLKITAPAHTCCHIVAVTTALEQ